VLDRVQSLHFKLKYLHVTLNIRKKISFGFGYYHTMMSLDHVGIALSLSFGGTKIYTTIYPLQFWGAAKINVEFKKKN
jgi:hypothetical protein